MDTSIMAANFDLIVIHGLPSPAVSNVLKQRVSDKDDYIHIHPAQLYLDHPSFGVRDVANSILGLLKKCKKVVVEDTTANGAVKDCLLKVIPNKEPSCTVYVIHLVPKHGQRQSLWERQFFLATSPQAHYLLSDVSLQCWFDDEGCFISPSAKNKVPANGKRETVKVNLTAASYYKFEVPALLVQWECMLDSGGFLEPKITTVCQRWSQANPCGRILFLCDGNSVARGHISAKEEKARIISCTKSLANELPCPVYLVQLTSTLDAGEFCVPPGPGLLAFLHMRHHLHLHHKNTLYVYKDVPHMKMSEKAGIRHIKVEKVKKDAELVLKTHTATPIHIPEMLQQMKVTANAKSDVDVTSVPPASLPLADHMGDFADNHICVEHPRGHREFVFAKDIQGFQRYEAMYAELATPLGKPGTLLARASIPQQKPEAPAVVEEVILTKQVSETTHLRQIPRWMLGRQGSSSGDLSTLATLEKSSSTSSIEGKGRSRTTVYVMTEKELLETAKEILKKAGEDAATDKPVPDDSTLSRSDRKRSASGGSLRDVAVAEDSSSSLSPDIVPSTSSERKKQRILPEAALNKEESHPGKNTDEKESIAVPQTSKESNKTHFHVGRSQQTEKQLPLHKRAPDLSVLDEIFF